jgi:hypothetical protein
VVVLDTAHRDLRTSRSLSFDLGIKHLMYQQTVRTRDALLCCSLDVANCVQKNPNEAVPQLAHEPFPHVPARSCTEAQSGQCSKFYSVFSIQCSSNVVQIYKF